MILENILDFEKIVVWFFTHGIKVLIILAIAFGINIFVKVFLYRFLKKAVKKGLSLGKKPSRAEQERAKTVIRVIISAARAAILMLAVLIVLPEFGVNIGPLLAGLGIVGLALGFGSRNLIQDYISGLFILLEDHYRVGEDVEIAGFKGAVVDFNLRRTVIRDKDSVLHYIPNNEVKKASNFSRKRT